MLFIYLWCPRIVNGVRIDVLMSVEPDESGEIVAGAAHDVFNAFVESLIKKTIVLGHGLGGYDSLKTRNQSVLI